MPKKKVTVKPSSRGYQLGPVRVSPMLLLLIYLVLVGLTFFAGLPPIIAGIAALLAGVFLIADGVRVQLTLSSLGYPALGVFLILYGIFSILYQFSVFFPSQIVGGVGVLAAVLLFLGLKRGQPYFTGLFTMVFFFAVLGLYLLFPAYWGAPGVNYILGLLALAVVVLIFMRK